MKKQIEEICKMAVMGCRRNPQAHTVEECIECDFKHGMCDVYRVAKKISENFVVLTKEEYEKLKSLANDKCHYSCDLIDFPDFEIEKKIRDHTRKETAREFAEKLKEFLSKEPFITKYEYHTIKGKIDEITKQFGVDLGE